MAQKEPENGPSLELPSLFGRRKRQAAAETSGTDPRAEHEAGDTAVEDRVVEDRVVEAPPAAAAPPAAPVSAPAPAPAPASDLADHTAVLPPVAQPVSRPVSQPVTEPAPTAAAEKPKRGRRAATTRTMPDVAASTAAFLVGAAVGLLGCVLTLGGLQGCELVTDTSSCGGPGLLVLVVILVVMVLAGTVALRALRVAEPGNVSLLGVGMMTVVALLFLADYLYDPWMFLVVPVVTAITFALARWVTTMYADDMDDDDRGMPHVDIR